jgi:hypothetical protein
MYQIWTAQAFALPLPSAKRGQSMEPAEEKTPILASCLTISTLAQSQSIQLIITGHNPEPFRKQERKAEMELRKENKEKKKFKWKEDTQEKKASKVILLIFLYEKKKKKHQRKKKTQHIFSNHLL